MGYIYQDLKTAVVEKDVEVTYRNYLEKVYKEKIDSPYDTDGILRTNIKFDNSTKKLILIMEYKLDENFNSSINVSKVLVQVLYYMKKFQDNGEILPTMVLVGDKTEAFVLHSNPLLKYLDEDIEWTLPPSEAGSNVSNAMLVQKINNDEEINPFVFIITPEFDFKEVTDKINMLTGNINRLVPITTQNITRIYEYFFTRVIVDYKKYDANDLVSIFISLMLNKEGSYLVPNKKNVLVVNDTRQIKVNEKAYAAFFSQFEQNYKPAERRKFTEIADRLIEDTNRRMKGEYYTPTAFVQYADERLQKNIGYRWKDTHVVWDSAWGTGNLTRDFSIRKLFASTINGTDLNMGKQYNAQGEKFQYDFLSDDPALFDNMASLELEIHIDDDPVKYKDYFKLPKKLLQYLGDNKQNILFFINPPYGTGGNGNSKKVESKKDLSKTVVGEIMRTKKMKVSEQLYAQFLYRILLMKRYLNLENVYIGLYSPSLFLTGSKYDKFRQEFLKDFTFCEGSIFKGSHFADVQGNWAIDFTIWKTKKISQDDIIPTDFKHTVIDLNENGQVEVIGEKVLWNLDNEKNLQDWIGQVDEKDQEIIEKPVFSSSFVPSGKLKTIRADSLGCLINDANNIEATVKGCYLLPNKTTRHLKSIPIIPENFVESMVVLTARNIYKSNWINQKNEFSAPNENHIKYKQFEVLSVIYSIFSSRNNIISYRALSVNGEEYNNLNEWFFMSNSEIKNLANEHNNVETYNDAISFSGERFVYNYLKENKKYISHEGQKIIVLASKIVRETFRFRNDFHYDGNENKFINTWDASWAQVKLVANTFAKSSMTEFNEYFKLFEVQLIEMADEIGFMKFK